MTVDNHDIHARDVIAETVHEALEADPNSDGCDHDTGTGSWSGQPNAPQCRQIAQDALTALGMANIHVVEDASPADGHDHVVMFVDRAARDALRALLAEPINRSIGYSEFIRGAVRSWGRDS